MRKNKGKPLDKPKAKSLIYTGAGNGEIRRMMKLRPARKASAAIDKVRRDIGWK